MALCKSCKKNTSSDCRCSSIDIIGLCNIDSVYFTNSSSLSYKNDYNWAEIPVPNVIELDENSLDVKNITSVYVSASIDSSRLIETPKFLETITFNNTIEYALDSYGYPIPLPNEEGTFLTGRKLVVNGTINMKLFYEICHSYKSSDSCNKISNDLNSVKFEVPFSAYITVYPKFLCQNFIVDECTVDLTEYFSIESFVESAYAKPLGPKTLYSSILLFIKATPLI